MWEPAFTQEACHVCQAMLKVCKCGVTHLQKGECTAAVMSEMAATNENKGTSYYAYNELILASKYGSQVKLDK